MPSMQRTIYALLPLSLLVACASKPAEPSMADLMREHKTELQAQIDLKTELARSWDQGTAQGADAARRLQDAERRARDAERRQRSAEADLRKAREDAERARRDADAARQRVADSERRFREAFPELSLSAKP